MILCLTCFSKTFSIGIASLYTQRVLHDATPATLINQTRFERYPVVQEKISVDAINAMLEDAAQGHELASSCINIPQHSSTFHIFHSPYISEREREREWRRELSQFEKSPILQVRSWGPRSEPLSFLMESWVSKLVSFLFFSNNFFCSPCSDNDTCNFKVHWHWIFPEMADDGLHRHVGMWRENLKTVTLET